MKLDKSKKLEIYTRYTKGERLKDLAKEHSVSLGTLTNWYYKYGFKIDLFKNQPKSKYNINDQFLEIIDTEQKAYFLGLMLSDGYVTGTNKVSVKLHKQDKELLDNIFSYITERPVIIRENTCEITICSKKLFQDLEKQGCIRNKTYSQMKLPVLKRELYSHFIRGYFDGDGSIAFRNARPNMRQIYICSICKEFLEELQSLLNSFCINTNINIELRENKTIKVPQGFSTNCKNMYKLNLCQHSDKLKFYEFLYKSSVVKLNRKFIKYKEYYDNTVLTLENNTSNVVQRIDNEPVINYSELESVNFHSFKRNRI